MKKMFDRAADLGVESIVIEMSHRGRLNIARWWCESASLSKLDEGVHRDSFERNLPSHVSHAMKVMNSDNTGTAAFLAFDMEVAKLTYVLASEAAQIVGIGVNAQVDTFQLKLNEVTSNHQNFTISRIFPTRELAPIPAFIVSGGVQVPEAVAPGLDARVVNAGKVAEQASTSDGSHPELSAPAKERFAEDEKALKKARLE
ncbi:hypothetical protein Bca52824_003092 [Brassica carinata]|uniref:Uncharacterized protein n=1 Tax=Brassica carinata TaxID=52824 RepID=A0A8X8BEF9_BRACI|nr:hypothetical protein Bca52824_003092 [Brassica carinata]